MGDILVVGSLAYDDVRTPVASRTHVLGGAASYFAMAAALYGKVRVVGVVGDDFRDEDIERLRKRGVDVAGIERRPGKSFRWTGTYDFVSDTAETINTELGVFGYLAECGGYDDPAVLRRAVLHGTVCASYSVERFSVDGIAAVDRAAVDARYR